MLDHVDNKLSHSSRIQEGMLKYRSLIRNHQANVKLLTIMESSRRNLGRLLLVPVHTTAAYGECSKDTHDML